MEFKILTTHDPFKHAQVHTNCATYKATTRCLSVVLYVNDKM